MTVQGSSNNRCFATVIQPNWVVTAAHCFSDLVPQSLMLSLTRGTTELYLQPLEPLDVHFAPGAVPIGAGPESVLHFTQAFTPSDLNCGHDLALVRLTSNLTAVPPAKIWSPAFCENPGVDCDLTGAATVFGGRFDEQDATASNKVREIVSSTAFKSSIACTRSKTQDFMLAMYKQDGLLPTPGDSGARRLHRFRICPSFHCARASPMRSHSRGRARWLASSASLPETHPIQTPSGRRPCSPRHIATGCGPPSTSRRTATWCATQWTTVRPRTTPTRRTPTSTRRSPGVPRRSSGSILETPAIRRRHPSRPSRRRTALRARPSSATA